MLPLPVTSLCLSSHKLGILMNDQPIKIQVEGAEKGDTEGKPKTLLVLIECPGLVRREPNTARYRALIGCFLSIVSSQTFGENAVVTTIIILKLRLGSSRGSRSHSCYLELICFQCPSIPSLLYYMTDLWFWPREGGSLVHNHFLSTDTVHTVAKMFAISCFFPAINS